MGEKSSWGTSDSRQRTSGTMCAHPKREKEVSEIRVGVHEERVEGEDKKEDRWGRSDGTRGKAPALRGLA